MSGFLRTPPPGRWVGVYINKAKLNSLVVKGQQCSYFAKGAPGSAQMHVTNQILACACKSDYLEYFDIDGRCRFVIAYVQLELL